MTAAGALPSPCINVCRMNGQRGLCEGCSRTLDEIAGWAAMSEADKRAVWQSIDERRAAIAAQPQPQA
jgi:predicted Fe-S protein YdhL (DUF1289 family)